MDIDISSLVLKNKLIEITTKLTEDKELSDKKSFFEVKYSTVLTIDDDLKDKKN